VTIFYSNVNWRRVGLEAKTDIEDHCPNTPTIEMRRGMGYTLLLVAVCLFELAAGECPPSGRLPELYDDTKFMCAQMWKIGEKNKYNSCKGDRVDVHNSMRVAQAPVNLNDVLKAAVVRPGCTLKLFEHPNFRGKVKTLSSGNDEYLSDMVNRVSSWRCDCGFSNELLTCKPWDEEVLIKTCKNTSPGIMRCQTQLATGVTSSKSSTSSNSVSASVTASVSGKYLAASFSLSVTVGYSKTWSNTHSKAYSTTKTEMVFCDLVEGDEVDVLQIIGHCGHFTVRSNTYECRSVKNVDKSTVDKYNQKLRNNALLREQGKKPARP